MTTAFLNADIVTPNKEVIVVKVPAVFRMNGIKEKCWRVRKDLYGLDVSPRSWSLSRNKTFRQVERLRPMADKSFSPDDAAQEEDTTVVEEQPEAPVLSEPSQNEFAASINRLERLDGDTPAKFVQLAEDANVWKVVLPNFGGDSNKGYRSICR